MEENYTDKSFRFYTRMHLSELTGVSAGNVEELLKCIKSIDGSSIYHHTHRFLQQHEYLNPEPANDFAYWVGDALGENRLAEALASIDTVSFKSIRALREELSNVISKYIELSKNRNIRDAMPGMEFNFVKTVSFIFPTGYVAYTPSEFADCLQKITSDSLYFHMFEARLRLDKQENDFSLWLRNSMGLDKPADAINRLDPYTHTIGQLRKAIFDILKKGGVL